MIKIESSKRNYNMDLLRIFSAMAVVVVHVCAKNFFSVDVFSSRFLAFNIFDSLVRWAVPVFFMLSGMFMLNPEKEFSLKKLYKKNALHIVTVFLFWSAVYVLFNHIINNKKYAVEDFIFGESFMWFLAVILFLYAFTPLLRKIAEDRKLCGYYVLIFAIIIVIIPSLLRIFSDAASLELDKLFNEKPRLPSSPIGINLNVTLGLTGLLFSGYYVYGYYLSRTEFSKTARILIYLLGIAAFVAIVIQTEYFSKHNKSYDFRMYSYLTAGVFFESTAVFEFFKNLKIRYSEKIKKPIVTVSSCCLCVYMVHSIFIELVNKYLFKTTDFNAYLSVPATFIIVFLSSLIIALILKHIPFVKKYFV